jgi:hypothetical protein
MPSSQRKHRWETFLSSEKMQQPYNKDNLCMIKILFLIAKLHQRLFAIFNQVAEQNI